MRNIFITILLALAASANLLAQTSGTCGTNLTWTYSSQTLTISGYGDMTNYSVNGSDAPWEIFSLSIRQVILPDGITSIGTGAFANFAYLSSITIPNSVTSIGDWAFAFCSAMTSVTMSENVTSIGSVAFGNCYKLKNITIPGSVVSIGSHAFISCNELESITCHAPIPPILGTEVFKCTSKYIPLYVLRNSRPLYKVADQWSDFYYIIGSDTTCGNNLVWTLQDSVLTITGTGDMYTFSHKDSVPWGPLYAGTIASVIIVDGVTDIGSYAFENCKNLTSITIPNSVTRIGNYAFDNCISLESISIPDSVKSIGAYGFGGCKKLTSISIPDSVKYINAHAFDNCMALTSITIPDSVTHIGDYAFAGCVGLQTITLPQALKRIGNYGFRGCSGLTSITIPEKVSAIGKYCFDRCSNLTSFYLLSPVPYYDDQWGIGVYLAFSWEGTFVHPDFSMFVPCGTLYTYEHSTGWNNYANQLKYEPHPNIDMYRIMASAQDTLMGYVTIDTLSTICDTLSPLRFSIKGMATNGYYLDHWSDGIANNPRTVEITQDTSFTAIFARKRSTLRTAVDHAIHGYTSGDTVALYFDTIQVQAIANHGYHFTQWSDGITENPRWVVLEDTYLTLTAYFENDVHIVNYQAINGSIQGPDTVPYSEMITITAIPDEWYCFAKWSDGVTENPRTVQITQDTTFVAEFIGQCGDSLYWSVSGDTLYFSGNGDMYSFQGNAPWKSQMNQLRQIELAPDMTSISDGAFYRASNLTSVIIPDKVYSVGSIAFLQCSELASISFGSGLQTIGDYGFANCNKIEKMTSYNTMPPSVGRECFRDVPRSAILFVPSSALSAYKQHSVWREFDVRPLDTAVDDIMESSSSHPQKILKGNHLYILLPDGTRYTATGQLVK